MNVEFIIETTKALSNQHFRDSNDNELKLAYQVSLLETKLRELDQRYRDIIAKMKLETKMIRKGYDNGHADRF